RQATPADGARIDQSIPSHRWDLLVLHNEDPVPVLRRRILDERLASVGVNRARAVRTIERERLSKARERGRVVALTVELDTLFIDSKNGFAPRIEYPACAQQLVYCR